MDTQNRLFASAIVSTAIVLSATSAFALNEGESGPISDMKAKLASEEQTEVMTAAAGSSPNVRGVKFYFNQVTKIGYIALTDNYAAPTAIRIVRKTTGTDFTGPVIVPQPIQGIDECKRIVASKPEKAKDCSSLYSSLKSWHDLGFVFFQQGKLDNGSTLITVLKAELGQGMVMESTPNGASLSTLPFAGAKYTAEGTRLLRR
ncbi:hypothetical protein [Polaromonas sp.]|uniref:hypothetical protein n=1 Tax=Polaromonas sp. TaxID=1869339 RepID=UPI0013B91D10|nr:hypothetical protein [Polaromonas sp.]NDP62958.1 hypothetical protein [Polaromonas sp.]